MSTQIIKRYNLEKREKVIEFKKLLVNLVDSNLLDDFFGNYINIIRNIIEIIPEVREFDEEGNPKDWVRSRKIRDKLKERNIKLRLGEVPKIIISLYPDVTCPEKVEGRLSARIYDNRYFAEKKLKSSYNNFKQRRGNGELYLFIRPQWITVWKSIYNK